jgi:hypothetical protein
MVSGRSLALGWEFNDVELVVAVTVIELVTGSKRCHGR